LRRCYLLECRGDPLDLSRLGLDVRRGRLRRRGFQEWALRQRGLDRKFFSFQGPRLVLHHERLRSTGERALVLDRQGLGLGQPRYRLESRWLGLDRM